MPMRDKREELEHEWEKDRQDELNRNHDIGVTNYEATKSGLGGGHWGKPEREWDE